MKTSFLTPDTQRGGLRIIGLALAVISVILPAFPLGPIAAHPWTPMAALWAAYGWAAEADDMEKLQAWRGVRAPATLAVLGFLQDWIAGGPIGLYMILYLSAYLIGRVAASAMRSPHLLSLWAGFVATCVGLCGVAAFVAPWALGGYAGLTPFAQACGVTALLFPFVRPLYMDANTV